MADEYIQESGGGSVGGFVGTSLGWMAIHRARQQSLAYSYGPLTEKNKLYKARRYTGYTSSVDELEAWNTGQGMKMGRLGSPVAAATRTMTTPLLGAQMLNNPGAIHASSAFAGTGFAGKMAEGMMDADRTAVWLADRMMMVDGKVAYEGVRGAYNKGLYSFLGGQVDEVSRLSGKGVGVGRSLGQTTAAQGVRQIAELGIEKAGFKLAGTAASRFVGYAVPVAGQALIAYDVGTLAYYGFTGVAKLGEAVHYKIPKSYFQASMKSFGRARFEGIGPASVMSGDNMNNRMRAVQAIQGSRLNARSALGNEAGLLAGHFG